MRRSRTAPAGFLSAALAGSLLGAFACGGHAPKPAARDGEATPEPPARTASHECTQPDADPALVGDRFLAGAMDAGPLVIYPVTDLAASARTVAPGPDVAVPVVLIPTVAHPVTVSIGRAARNRFSLLFGGARTGGVDMGFRVEDGKPKVRLPACASGPFGFRGGFLYRPIAQCVPIAIRSVGTRSIHATIALGRRPASCPGALRPRPDGPRAKRR